MSSGEGPLMEPLGQVTGGGEVGESDLGPLPALDPELEHFLEAPTAMHPEEDVPASCQLPPALQRSPAETTAEDPGLCPSHSVLG